MIEKAHEADEATLTNTVLGEQDNGKIEIPDYAIERFAKFLLPKIRSSLGAEKKTAG